MVAQKSPYHSGELKIQELAGVREPAKFISQIVHSSIPPIARDFLATQRWVFAASRASEGSLWCSLLTGQPGFMSTPDKYTVGIAAEAPQKEVLARNIGATRPIGLLAIDFFTRRRMKVKGEAQAADGTVVVRAHQVFSICQKYIQQREVARDAPAVAPASHRDIVLDATQQEWIRTADTFLIATYNTEIGLNVGHRGGRPGFVRVLDNRTLRFPDYPGNCMYNTLGNLTVDSHAGLLFLNFEKGTALQVAGRGQVIADPQWLAEFAGARFVVEFTVDDVIQTDNATTLRWRLLGYSPYDP